jgi:hypothetical protein
MAWQARLYTFAGTVYNTRNRMAALEIIRKRRLRGEVAKLVAAQDAADIAEDLETADLKRERQHASRANRRKVRSKLWKGTKEQRHRWRREKLMRMLAMLLKKIPPWLVAANEAPELEDGFESVSFPDVRDDIPGLCPAWLLPARWTPTTAQAPSSGAKRVTPRGSVANPLLWQQYLSAEVKPRFNREHIDADYSPSPTPPDSPPDPPLPQPLHYYTKRYPTRPTPVVIPSPLLAIAGDLRKQQLRPAQAFRRKLEGAMERGRLRDRDPHRQRSSPYGYRGDSQTYVGGNAGSFSFVPMPKRLSPRLGDALCFGDGAMRDVFEIYALKVPDRYRNNTEAIVWNHRHRFVGQAHLRPNGLRRTVEQNRRIHQLQLNGHHTHQYRIIRHHHDRLLLQRKRRHLRHHRHFHQHYNRHRLHHMQPHFHR